MKKVVVGLCVVVVGGGLYGVGWMSHRSVDKAMLVPVVSSSNSSLKPAREIAASSAPPAPAPWITRTEWSSLHQGREGVLQANPEMAAEYKQLLVSMDANQKKLDAAMIKVDRKVAPVIAKLVILRQRNSVPAPGANKPVSAIEPTPTLSPEDWQEVRTARAAALHANPSLTSDADKLRIKMSGLNDKIDAAMLKSDPNLAPLVAKVEANRPHPTEPAGASPSSPR